MGHRIERVQLAIHPLGFSLRAAPAEDEDDDVDEDPKRQRHQDQAARHVWRRDYEADDQSGLAEDRRRQAAENAAKRADNATGTA